MSELLLHPTTRAVIDRLSQRTVHALLLTGEPGAGKQALAELIAAKMFNSGLQKIQNHPFVLRISPDDSSISIEQIRSLQKFLALKTFGSNSIRRIVIIDSAELMTHQAQNSLLKTLEEPPLDTQIILTASFPEELLPTIISRTTTLNITPIDEASALKYFANLHFHETEIRSAYMLSSGAAGLMSALLQQQKDHPIFGDIAAAKTLLAQSKYERLTTIETVSKQRPDTLRLLIALKRICRSALYSCITKQDIEGAQKWTKRLSVVARAEGATRINANLKLLLSELFLAL